MTRCHLSDTLSSVSLRRFLRKSFLLTAFACAALTAVAQTQSVLTIRNFPAKAQRGVMQVLQPPEILLNEKLERLSPGSRIRGANNMLVMSGALVGQNHIVNYVREPQGLIHEVWILNEAELLVPLPNLVPQPRFN